MNSVRLCHASVGQYIGLHWLDIGHWYSLPQLFYCHLIRFLFGYETSTDLFPGTWFPKQPCYMQDWLMVVVAVKERVLFNLIHQILEQISISNSIVEFRTKQNLLCRMAMGEIYCYRRCVVIECWCTIIMFPVALFKGSTRSLVVSSFSYRAATLSPHFLSLCQWITRPPYAFVYCFHPHLNPSLLVSVRYPSCVSSCCLIILLLT